MAFLRKKAKNRIAPQAAVESATPHASAQRTILPPEVKEVVLMDWFIVPYCKFLTHLNGVVLLPAQAPPPTTP